MSVKTQGGLRIQSHGAARVIDSEKYTVEARPVDRPGPVRGSTRVWTLIVNGTEVGTVTRAGSSHNLSYASVRPHGEVVRGSYIITSTFEHAVYSLGTGAYSFWEADEDDVDAEPREPEAPMFVNGQGAEDVTVSIDGVEYLLTPADGGGLRIRATGPFDGIAVLPQVSNVVVLRSVSPS